MLDGTCTSCEVTDDTSAYCTNALYFKFSAGEYTLVDQVDSMLAYVLFMYDIYGRTHSLWSSAKLENIVMLSS